MGKNSNTAGKTGIALIVTLCMILTACSGGGGSASPSTAPASTGTGKTENAFSYWNEGAEASSKLTEYMKAVTDKNSPDFIPEEKRIAVFDLDGTLFGETNPIYFDYSLLVYRVLQDSEYKDKASAFEKEVSHKIIKGIQTGEFPDDIDTLHGQALASAFKGMTLEEFVEYCTRFRQQEAPGYEGLKREDSYYKPMLQVLDYLKTNNFKIYIVSATERQVVRAIIKDRLDISTERIIGSDAAIVASGQGDKDGTEYVFTNNDKLTIGGKFIHTNFKMNKVASIAREIGDQPVLSFGNSSGDYSMAEYVITGNKYKAMAFMLCCDDTSREYGNETKAQSMKDQCSQHGWIPISMKNDWKTIYGDGVTKNPDKGLSFYYEYKIS